MTRRWSSALLGAGAGLAILVLLTVALGPALVLVPIATLRLLVGALLLVFGLQWLRKAILRASGLLALHDEIAAFEREAHSAEAISLPSESFDGYSFVVALKGVLLEGPRRDIRGGRVVADGARRAGAAQMVAAAPGEIAFG